MRKNPDHIHSFIKALDKKEKEPEVIDFENIFSDKEEREMLEAFEEWEGKIESLMFQSNYAEPTRAMVAILSVYDAFNEGFDTLDLKEAKARAEELSTSQS